MINVGAHSAHCRMVNATMLWSTHYLVKGTIPLCLKKLISGARKAGDSSRYHMILQVRMWGSDTLLLPLLLLNLSCWATRTTTTPTVSLYHGHQRRKASNKAKPVDNGSDTTKYCTGTSARVGHVDCFTSCCCCTTYTIYEYDIRYTRSCCLRVCGPEKIYQVWLKTKPRRGAPRMTDKRCARSCFGITTTNYLPSFFLQGLGWLLAAIGLH